MESSKKTNLTPIYVLLFIILIILVMGLFKQEVAVIALLAMPQDVSVYKDINYACKQQAPNPRFSEEVEKIKKDKCTDRSRRDSSPFGFIGVFFPDQDCINAETEKLKKGSLSEYILVDSTCTKTIKETWFYALGRNWFKKGERIIIDTQK